MFHYVHQLVDNFGAGQAVTRLVYQSFSAHNSRQNNADESRDGEPKKIKLWTVKPKQQVERW